MPAYSKMYIFASPLEVDGTIKLLKKKSNLNIFITPWSISHFIVGYMCKMFGLNYIFGLMCHTIYEYINYSDELVNKETSKEWQGFKNDSIFNSIGDTVIFLLGMFLAKNYNNWYLFIFIFLLGLFFYSPNCQSYLQYDRVYYLEDKGFKLNVENILLHTREQYVKCFQWIIVCFIIFVMLKKNIKLYKII